MNFNLPFNFEKLLNLLIIQLDKQNFHDFPMIQIILSDF